MQAHSPHSRDPAGRASSIAQHTAAWCVLLGAAGVLAWVSWLGWGHPIIDLGREVYVPWQLREGRLLYGDLIYNYGPIAPYLAAAVTGVFGDNLAVHAWWGAAIGVATMAGLYVIGCLLSGTMVGFAAAMLFVLLSFFGYSTFGCNYILPYAQAATLSMTLAVWSLYLLMLYVYRGRRLRHMVPGAALMIAALLTKQEVGLAIAGTWLVGAWAHRAAWRDVGIVMAMACAALVAMETIFSGGEHGLWSENLLRFADADSAASFFGDVSGMARWRTAGQGTLAATGIVAAVMALASRARRSAVWSVVAVVGIAAALRYADVYVFRAALPLAVVAIGWCAIKDKRNPLLLVAVMTLLGAARVFMAFEPTWYGFYLYVPAYVLLAYALGVWLAPRPMVVMALVLLGGVAVWRFNARAIDAYQAKTATLVTSKGVMHDEPIGRAEAIGQCLGYLDEHADRGATLVVLPEGAMLNWWSGLANPTAYSSFIPPELTDDAVQQRMVSELERTRPDFIAINSRPLREFGEETLSYMPAVMGYVQQHYEMVQRFGGGQWRIALLRRKGE